MPDLQKCGGLEEGQRIANLAHYYYKPFSPPMVASFPCAMATSRIWASVPKFMILEWQAYFHTDQMWKDIVKYEPNGLKRASFLSENKKYKINGRNNQSVENKQETVPGVF